MLFTIVIMKPQGLNHAIYIGLIDIEIETQEINMSVKVFSDDLEDAIQLDNGERVKIVGQTDFSDLLTIIETYIIRKSKVYLDDVAQKFHIASCENQGDTTWIFLSGEINSSYETVRVDNQLFFEIFDTQTNVVKIAIDGKLYYYKLSKDTPSAEVTP